MEVTYFRGPESCRHLGDAPRAFIGFFRLFLLCAIFKTPRLISHLRLSRLDWFKESYRCKRPRAARISRLLYLTTHVGGGNRVFSIFTMFLLLLWHWVNHFRASLCYLYLFSADNTLRAVSVLPTWLKGDLGSINDSIAIHVSHVRILPWPD